MEMAAQRCSRRAIHDALHVHGIHGRVAATSSGRHRHGSLDALPPRSQPALDQHSSTRWAAAMRGLDPRGRTRADNVPVRADASVT
jgi:hypothetical protein